MHLGWVLLLSLLSDVEQPGGFSEAPSFGVQSSDQIRVLYDALCCYNGVWSSDLEDFFD